MKVWTKVGIGIMIIVISFIAFGIYSSFKVTGAFMKINEKLEDQNDLQVETNKTLYEKVENDSLKDSANKIQKIFEDFDNSLRLLKQELVEFVKPKETEDVDRTVDDFFFSGDEISTNGQHFIEIVSSFQKELKRMPEVYENESILNRVNEIYQENVKTRNNHSTSWIEYHYKGFPFISSITKISSLQNDAVIIETAILKTL